jgi:hypothetical protein
LARPATHRRVSRDDRDFYLDLDAPKQRWVRPLHPQGLAWLAADALPPALAALIPAAAPRCAYQSAQRDPLWQRFQDRLTDPRARRGKRHLLASILAGQPRRAQARPETYHLPDCHRDGRFGLKAAVGWLALRYTPP